MVAVIRVGGKQRRVRAGDVVRVEALPEAAGEAVVFEEVLALGEGEALRVGTPTIAGARVLGTVLEQGRAEKIVTYTFKKRKNANRKRRGHRQSFSAVRIEAIEG